MLRIRIASCTSSLALLLTAGCAAQDDLAGSDTETTGEAETGDPDAYTWWRDVEPIVREKCAGCHADGEIAPFALETHEQFAAFSALAGDAIEAGIMPPWPPDPNCNSFENPRSLTADQEEVLLSYIASDMPEGDPADAVPEEDPPPEFVADILVEMPEAYTPVGNEDYRCFVIPWPEDIDVEQYVTGFAVYPGETSIVHHVILFAVDAQDTAPYLDLDASEPGPGYTCFGGPGQQNGSAAWLGGWAPGVQPFRAPEGVGQRVEPGTMLIMQVHYNVAGGQALADRSSVGIELSPAVEREARVVPILDLSWVAGNGSMAIPAGEAEVTHEATVTTTNPVLANALIEFGVAPDADLEIWNAGLHMHLYGTRGRIAVRDAGGGAEQCLLDVPRWDFHWQSNFTFEQPVVLRGDQELHLQCWWDNSAANQPIVDGQPLDPIDRDWGESTLDEMCLGILYISPAAP